MMLRAAVVVGAVLTWPALAADTPVSTACSLAGARIVAEVERQKPEIRTYLQNGGEKAEASRIRFGELMQRAGPEACSGFLYLPDSVVEIYVRQIIRESE